MKNDKKFFLTSFMTIFVMVACMIASIASCVFSIVSISRKNYEKDCNTISYIISGGIENTFIKPIMVAQSMTQSPNIISAFKLKKIENTKEEDSLIKYLKSVHDKFEYEMIYVVSDISKAYYTYDGITKYVDIDKDENDLWYKNFLAAGKKLEVVVDNDEDMNWDWTFFVNAPVFDDENEFLGVCGTGVAITKLQEMLSEYEKAYDVKIRIFDKDGIVRLSSDATEFGTSGFDVSYFSKVGSDDFLFENIYKTVRLSKYLDSVGMYIVIQKKAVDTRNLFWIILPSIIIFLIGLLILFIIIHLFSSQVKIRNYELSEYNEIVGNAGLGIWYIFVKDGERPRMKINEKMRELLGIKDLKLSAEEIYSYWYDRIVDDDKISVKNSIRDMSDGNFYVSTYQWIHPEKGLVYSRNGGSFEKLLDGTTVLSGYYCDVTDIVEKERRQQEILKEALIAAENSNKAKTTFLNNMSHDIRTPMNAIVGYANLLKKDISFPEKLLHYQEKIEEASDFLLSLINNVLDMAKIESGRMELDENVNHAGDIISNIMNVFEDYAKKKDIVIEHNVNVTHYNIICDLTKTRQIFSNLISNSIKYTTAGGKITISTVELPCDKEGYGIFQSVIEDNGIGMSSDFLPHLFDSFSRERNTTYGKVAGTGLGMAIVKELVNLMGGKIEVESELGVGSKFTVTLMHKFADESYYAKHSDFILKDESFMVNDKRILMAEDNELNAEIAIAILEEVGFKVERAEDGIICVDMLNKAEIGYYDLILMDIQMPNMDGYKATRTIRCMKDDGKKNIPIIAMTANAFAEDRKNAIDAGMNGHVAKPINVNELIATIKQIMNEA